MWERNIDQLLLIRVLTGDGTHNPGMCSHWEWNQRPFALRNDTQATKPHQSGQGSNFKITPGALAAWFSWLKHRPLHQQGYVWVRSPIGVHTGGNWSMLLSHINIPLFLSPPSLKSIKHILGWGFKKKALQVVPVTRHDCKVALPGWPGMGDREEIQFRISLLILGKGINWVTWYKDFKQMLIERELYFFNSKLHFFFLFFKKRFYLFITRERGKEREREGEKHQCVVVSHTPPTGDPARNPGMCPDQEPNWWPPGFQASSQSTEPHQPRLSFILLYTVRSLKSEYISFNNSCVDSSIFLNSHPTPRKVALN